ncbi:MAG TPA: hypothetical protein PK264_09245, partial [Hyphomicrobiaceae bacterium]|nr:hypothetical protein [Hyphomicrobiaceae bacterium]
AETITYFEEALARPPGRSDDPLRDGVKMGTTLVGTPETISRGINKLIELSKGGIGGVMFRAHEWANREQTLRSYELFARWVMPRFQGALEMQTRSHAWVSANQKAILGENAAAFKKAYTDHGRDVPTDFDVRILGGALKEQKPGGKG